MFFVYNLGEKNKGKIVSREEAREFLNHDENAIRGLTRSGSITATRKWQSVPCRKCWACQLNYSAEWATRIMCEAKKSDHNYFITLTYDNEHIPVFESMKLTYDDHIEEIINDGTWKESLYPQDVTAFIKALRKPLERKGITGVKYFYAGEYGENTERPHYHMILMNCPLDIKEFYSCKVDPLHLKAHWKSHQLEKYWDKGFIDVAELEWSCAAYVARYCTKKLSFKNNETYYESGRLPEFVRMSNGIGMDYYEEHKEQIYHNDEMIMKTVKGNTGSFRPPKAFDKKMKEENPDFFKKLQKSREHEAQRRQEMIESLTDYTDKKMLQLKTENLSVKMKMLPRE